MFIRNALDSASLPSLYFASLKDYIRLELSPLQQKVASVALLLLSYTAVLYLGYHYCFKAKKDEEGEVPYSLFDRFRKPEGQDTQEDSPPKAPKPVTAVDSKPHHSPKTLVKSTEASLHIITQADYLAYKHALADISVVCKCEKKGDFHLLEEVEGHLQKRAKDVADAAFLTLDEWLRKVILNNALNLKQRIKVINEMHAKLYAGQDEPNFGEYILAVDEYNSCLKVMHTWNRLWEADEERPKFVIQSPVLNEVSPDPILEPMSVYKPLSEDEKALQRYFELLKKYPQLKREGEENDHTKGIFEIVYDVEKMQAIQANAYQRFYKKFGSHELAAKASRPGVVFEDAFWIILRDCVITPKGTTLTYNRLVNRSELGQSVGAAVMPIIQLPTGETKISLVLHYRHATQSWEFELPRGGSEPGETAEQAARRELREETGYEVEKPIHLGTFPPNSGAESQLVPVFSGKVTVDTGDEIDEAEAIKGKFLFTYDEIMQALKSPDSCLEVLIDGEKKRYPVRDPFLYCALLLSDDL